MFGNLFDDEKPAGVMSSAQNTNISHACPPPPRHPCGFSGIANQGATCYLNSLLQTLLFTPEFREGLFKLADDELGSIGDREKGGKVRIIPLQLQRIFARLLLVDQQAASTSELTESFGWSNKEGLQQHDVQELNRILFSAIESSLVGTSGSDLISKLYHGSTVSEIVCQMCGKISEREEDFLDLNVIVSNFSSLQESLNATFLQKEIMKGKNQYRCSTCCNLVDAKKGLKIRCLPPILTLSLSRFSYDTVKGERYKETGRFVFPKEIDMSSYCDKPLFPDDSLYELFSVVIHSGSSYGGHYHAYIRDVDFLGKWYPPNEEIIILTSDNGWEEFDCPVELIKMLLFQAEDTCLPIDTLCREISKRTGFSWNKKFKKTQGPITKFLQKYSDIFYLNPSTNIVHLKDNVAFHESMNDDIITLSEPEVPKDTKKTSMKAALKLNFFEKKKVQNDSPEVIQNWYDFNDSRVLPLCVKDIEKQYGGKESAYMLFYRRKSLLRPEEAKGNPCYMMPLQLIELAEAENIDLNNQRELYDAALNTIVIFLQFSNNFVYERGALQVKDESIRPAEIVIDKRKSLLNLREVIEELSSSTSTQPNEGMHLYIAKELPSGLHLARALCEFEDCQSLEEIGIQEGSKIFACETNEVEIVNSIVGPLCEPILLHISAMKPTGEMSEMSLGFPKSCTIHGLKENISDILNLELDDMVLSKMDLQGETTQVIQMEQQLDSSLSDLGFVDGDSIIVESATYKNLKAQEKEVQSFSIMIQNNCSRLGESSNCDVFEVSADSEATVGALKSLALSKLAFDDTRQYVLRKYSENGVKGPPLHENQNLKSSGLSEIKCLSLEEGEPPSDEEIVLRFGIKGIADVPPSEMKVNKKMTVQQCLKLVLTNAGLKGDSWHLQKTNWCGEPMEILFLETATLEDENIHHGDFLYVATGHVPPKGFINLTIWLYPTYENLQISQSALNGILSDYEKLYKSIFLMVEHECGLVKLGDVELSAESSLAELKKYVLTLPLLSPVSLPNVKFLRLRLIDGNRPGKVLRCLTNTLRKLKIKSHQSLCVQLLPFEEDMAQNELLLNICQRIPDSRTYTSPSEMTWDTSKSATPKALKQAISECIGVPTHRLAIAKHFPDKFQWLVIEENFNQKKSNKNRWSSKKANLRYSPYFLRDGDTVGVKDQLADPNDADDFSTKEDIEGQEILRIAAEGKRQRRQSRNSNGCGEWFLGGSESESTRFSKKSEIGITIHVDDFR